MCINAKLTVAYMNTKETSSQPKSKGSTALKSMKTKSGNAIAKQVF